MNEKIINIKHGDTHHISLHAVNKTTGQPLPLTGYSAVLTVKNTATDTAPLFDVTTSAFLDVAETQMRLTINQANSLLLAPGRDHPAEITLVNGTQESTLFSGVIRCARRLR